MGGRRTSHLNCKETITIKSGDSQGQGFLSCGGKSYQPSWDRELVAKNSFREVTVKLNPEGRMEVFQMDRGGK